MLLLAFSFLGHDFATPAAGRLFAFGGEGKAVSRQGAIVLARRKPSSMKFKVGTL
jgi:hypothetical protein